MTHTQHDAAHTASTDDAFDPAQLIDRLPSFEPRGLDATRLQHYCAFYQLPSQQPDNEQRLGQLPLAGYRIAIHRWVPRQAQGTLLIVHGYLDHHGLYQHLIRYALQRQLAVVCFDLPGHGLSSGPRAEIDSFEQYQQLLSAVLQQVDDWSLPKPLHLLGQSTGAAILNQYLLTQRPPVTGAVVLLAPLVRAARWPLVSFSHRLLHRLTDNVPRSFKANSNDPDFSAFLPTDPLQARVISARWIGALKAWIPRFLALPPSELAPLVIQGEQDDTVDWRYNLDILQQKFPAQQLLRLPEARHQLANESDPIRQHYFAWIDRHWPVAVDEPQQPEPQ